MKPLIAIILSLLLTAPSPAAVRFTPGGNYARENDTGNLPQATFSTNWTFCTQVKTTNVNPGLLFNLMDHENFAGTNIQFQIFIDASGHVGFYNGTSNIFLGSANFADGAWHAYCLTRDGANHWNSYIGTGGVVTLDASATNAFAQVASTTLSTGFHQGAFEFASNTCECSIAETVWYQTVLTLDQIKAYARGVTPSNIDILHMASACGACGMYWPNYFYPGLNPGAVPDGSSHLHNGIFSNTQGSYFTANHCPCGPPAGAESH